MRLIANLVRRVRLRILAIRIRLLNISIVIAAARQVIQEQRIERLIRRSTALGIRYRDLKDAE